MQALTVAWTLSSILLLAACGATAPVDEKAATAESGYGRAFGRVSYLEDGKAVGWASTLTSTNSLTFFVRSARTGQMQYMEIPDDGSFFWPLERGEYVIVGYQLARRSIPASTRTGRLMATFSVPQAGQAVYIGDLLIETGRRGGRIDVMDRYQPALERAGARIAEGKLTPAQGLMRPEQAPGQFRRVTDICGAAWGIECDANYRGVQPVAPEGTAWNYSATKDLAPLLEWKPSGRPEVTYDVAIYESLEFMFGATGGVKGLRGTRVAYAEGLREPRYVPATPLEPAKRYEWTVRLRDGDTVSSWSTTSYSFFAVIAARRAFGQYFGFETPRK